MADLDALVAELRKRIAEKRKELADQEEALAVLEKVVGTTSSASGGVRVLEQGVIKLDELDLEEHAGKRRGTLMDDVLEVIGRLGDQEFSVVHIDALLRKMGKVTGEKSIRSRISMMLSKLEEEGTLERTFAGKGNVPHRYRRKGLLQSSIDELLK